MLETTALLIVAAFVTGLINGSVGGGGLFLLPASLSLLPHELPATVFGTNKFAAVFGTGVAARHYARHVPLPWALIFPAIISAFIAAFFGAMVVAKIPVAWIKPMVLVVLVVMTLYTFVKKDFGLTARFVADTKGGRWKAAIIGAVSGFYDGAFGPGVGNMMSFLLIRFLSFDFLRAVAASRVLNFVTNLAALSFFIPSGHILWKFAVFMAAANMAGGYIGARLMVKGGVKVIRVVFLLLMVALIGKLSLDVIFAHIG